MDEPADEFMIAAMREVDELTPSVPPLAPPRAAVVPCGASPVGILKDLGADYRSDDCYVLADGSVLTGAWVHLNFRAALERAAAAKDRSRRELYAGLSNG